MGELNPKEIIKNRVEEYLPELMPLIMPSLMAKLMAELLAKPDQIVPDWLTYLDLDFGLEEFITEHFEKPLTPEGLSVILTGYEPEDAVEMVYALAAYVHFNRLKADFPGEKRKGKPGPKPGRKHRRGKTKKGRQGGKKTAPVPEKKDTSLPANAFKKKKFAAAYRKKYPGKGNETLLLALARSFNEHPSPEDWEKAMLGAGIAKSEFVSNEYFIWRSDPKIKKHLVARSRLQLVTFFFVERG